VPTKTERARALISQMRKSATCYDRNRGPRRFKRAVGLLPVQQRARVRAGGWR
jgi:hypothetical protein